MSLQTLRPPLAGGICELRCVGRAPWETSRALAPASWTSVEAGSGAKAPVSSSFSGPASCPVSANQTTLSHRDLAQDSECGPPMGTGVTSSFLGKPYTREACHQVGAVYAHCDPAPRGMWKKTVTKENSLTQKSLPEFK